STVLSGFDLSCTGNSTAVSPIPNIGYVKVGTCGCSGADAAKFAEDIQAVIRNQDNANLKGWIVDLRGNGGGNMWPMLAGISSVLGDGVVGHFIDPDNKEAKWSVTAGTSLYEGSVVNAVANPYRLINPNPKVAVLLDQGCASSGEAIAVAFIGRPKTMSFGVGTCGLSTANATYFLSDGAQFQLTVSLMADRNKVTKGGSIVPDVTVAGDKEVVNKAVEWINQP
ncbi:MAG TPA: S41 family peptidase, partial [Cyclobacteriaceae bacterium]|nr:S41 family peptidase [Cyclobacteriaceae bacterium]